MKNQKKNVEDEENPLFLVSRAYHKWEQTISRFQYSGFIYYILFKIAIFSSFSSKLPLLTAVYHCARAKKG